MGGGLPNFQLNRKRLVCEHTQIDVLQCAQLQRWPAKPSYRSRFPASTSFGHMCRPGLPHHLCIPAWVEQKCWRVQLRDIDSHPSIAKRLRDRQRKARPARGRKENWCLAARGGVEGEQEAEPEKVTRHRPVYWLILTLIRQPQVSPHLTFRLHPRGI